MPFPRYLAILHVAGNELKIWLNQYFMQPLNPDNLIWFFLIAISVIPIRKFFAFLEIYQLINNNQDYFELLETEAPFKYKIVKKWNHKKSKPAYVFGIIQDITKNRPDIIEQFPSSLAKALRKYHRADAIGVLLGLVIFCLALLNNLLQKHQL